MKRPTKVKPFRPPKPKGDWPEPPLLDGTPPFHGDEVTHPEHGWGVYAWADWVGPDGKWVDPSARGANTRRDTTRGHWEAVVTTKIGGYRCPINQLSRV